MESEKKLLKEHLKVYYEKRGIKQEANLVHFFGNLEDELEQTESTKETGSLEALEPIFSLMKSIFLEIIYQMQ